MKCPKCEVIELTMADRAGVEIDYCSACRGVWLDRGEHDKIIERAAPVASYGGQPSESSRLTYDEGRRRDDDDDGEDEDRGGRKRRGSFLGELFDF